MKLPNTVKKNIGQLKVMLKEHIESYIKNLINEYIIKEEKNRVEYTYIIPTQRNFEAYIYDVLKEICDYRMNNISVSYEDKVAFHSKDNTVMWLVIEGYQMPVRIHFTIDPNIFENGKISAGVWINDYVAQKI
jgi:hypothetical protein